MAERPVLDDDSRARGRRLALEARRRRADIKRQVAAGGSIRAVLALSSEDPAVARMRARYPGRTEWVVVDDGPIPSEVPGADLVIRPTPLWQAGSPKFTAFLSTISAVALSRWHCSQRLVTMELFPLTWFPPRLRKFSSALPALRMASSPVEKPEAVTVV